MKNDNKRFLSAEFKTRTEAGLTQPFFITIPPNDNVLVVLKDLAPGTQISSNNGVFELRENVAAKHKFFEQNMHAGDHVMMYGTLVGQLQSDVVKGQAMTTTNTKHAAGKYAYRSLKYNWQ